MITTEHPLFDFAAHSSIAPPGATSRPTRVEQLERDFWSVALTDVVRARLVRDFLTRSLAADLTAARGRTAMQRRVAIQLQSHDAVGHGSRNSEHV